MRWREGRWREGRRREVRRQVERRQGVQRQDRPTRQSCRVGRLARWYARALGAQVQVVDGLYVCAGLPDRAFPRGGVTFGDTYLTGRDPGTLTAERLRHERTHRDQWHRYGYLMGPLYLLAGPDPRRNRFEVEAGLADGGYPD